MKIEILIDGKSEFPEEFIATIKGVKYLSSKITDIAVNQSHEIICPRSGMYLDGDFLVSELHKRNKLLSYDKTVFLTKAPLSSQIQDEEISTYSFYDYSSQDFQNIEKILKLFDDPFSNLLTEAEKRNALSIRHPVYGHDSALRFKLPLKDVVFTIHGMNTHANWEKDLAGILNRNGVFMASGHYDKFLKVVIPSKRAEVRSIITKKYDEMVRSFPPDEFRYTVIAHSYGTYGFFDVLVNEAPHRHPDTIIFAASILDRKHTLWGELARKGTRVYLDIGKRDFVTKVAGFLRLTGANLAGLSGWLGVKGGCDITVDGLTPEAYLQEIRSSGHNKSVNLIHTGKRHSDYFSDSHFENRWLPIIKQEQGRGSGLAFQHVKGT